ncbi:hypothetical protein J4450_00770 [Candidatus Micrarchaeota archaeon]|nr:hypothetical protein [Candidatus Micrarchaeota archaeon]
MEFDELLITTGVDALVRLVREKQRVELKTAAALLNIPEATIEEWSHILEEEGIVKIEYYLTKIYLAWVTPTEEKIKVEKEMFYQEKANVEKEISELKSRLAPDTESLSQLKQTFTKFYNEFGPRLDKLEKELASMAGQKNTEFEKQKLAITNVDEKLFMLEDSLKVLKNELEKIRLDLTGEDAKKSFERIYEEVASLSSQLEDVASRASNYQKEIPSEFPPVSEVKKKFEQIKKDFDNVKNTNAKMRDDLVSIQESSGVLKEVESSIKKYETRISDTKKDLAELSDTAEELRSKSTSLAEKINKDMEIIERFSDSIDIAKGVLQRFPSQDEIAKELARVKKVEDGIQEKIGVVSELLHTLPNIKNLTDEFAQIKRRAEEKKTELEDKSEEIKDTLKEGASTYATFEKIKERTLLSIQTYNAQLQAIADDINKLKKESQQASAQLDQSAKTYQEKLKKQDVLDVLKAAEDIKNKKLLMDEINSSLDSLSETAESIAKRLNLLAKEAGMLDLRTGGAVTVKDVEQEKQMVNQIKLTRQEEDEFNKKREELKELIKKLWEQS